MGAKLQAMFDRTNAMFVQSGRCLGSIRQVVVRFFFGLTGTPSRRDTSVVEDAGVAVMDVATVAEATTDSRRRNACVRPVIGGCHQCWTSPSGNWCPAARSRCSRQGRLGMDQAPRRPAIDREIRTHRPTDRIPFVPKTGRSGFGKAASHWPSCLRAGRGYPRIPRPSVRSRIGRLLQRVWLPSRGG